VGCQLWTDGSGSLVCGFPIFRPRLTPSPDSLVFHWLKGGGNACCARLPGSCCARYQHRLMLAVGLMAAVLSGDTLTLTSPRSTTDALPVVLYSLPSVLENLTRTKTPREQQDTSDFADMPMSPVPDVPCNLGTCLLSVCHPDAQQSP
jgi:hypothetical protein